MVDSEVIASFCGVTGADSDVAIQMLEATNGDLESAINFYFAAEGAAGGPDRDDDEALARRLQQEANEPLEDAVRAPMPVVNQRLVGDLLPGPIQTRRRAVPIPQSVANTFRESMDASEQPSSGGLAASFEPPRELLFHGSFEDAKESAASKEQWLLLNLQAADQFASHQLNRDTWRDPMISGLVSQNFVLFQVYQGVEEAEVLCGVYRVSKLPCILAIDPATGALMRQWAGFLPPDRLAEELMPFLEHTFLDPGASALAANRRRRAAPSAPAGSLPRAGAASEDAELAAAIAASLEPKAESGLTSAGRAAGAAPAQPSGSDAPPAAAARGEAAAGPIPAAAVAAEAAARLPVETSGPGSCRVAVRCPDGSRLQRRFEQTAPLETLRDLCIASCPEAAAGRPFFLAPSFPGAQPLLDMAADLTTSGAADSMLVMKWAE
uniref:UBX domain-containing protein n=1 Tax=Auxenochlorella protothecoides TaxID=3075 RepID=A0A1D1ZUZ7_AUXPR